jgi:hypothetical protein
LADLRSFSHLPPTPVKVRISQPPLVLLSKPYPARLPAEEWIVKRRSEHTRMKMREDGRLRYQEQKLVKKTRADEKEFGRLYCERVLVAHAECFSLFLYLDSTILIHNELL